MSYEETALAGKLTEEQLDAIIAAFVRTSDIGLIARSLDLPRALVLAALEDGTLAARALAAKKNAATVRFIGLTIDRMLAVLALPASKGSTHEALQAARLLRDLLGLQSVVTPPSEPGKPAADVTAPPAAKSLEQALAELDN